MLNMPPKRKGARDIHFDKPDISSNKRPPTKCSSAGTFAATLPSRILRPPTPDTRGARTASRAKCRQNDRKHAKSTLGDPKAINRVQIYLALECRRMHADMADTDIALADAR
jgi:hypothetical protein